MSNRILTVSDYISMTHNQPSNTDTVCNNTTNNNVTNNIPDTFDDSDNSLSNASSPSILEDSETAAPQRSTRNGENQVYYKKFFQRGKAADVKTNSSVLLNYLPSKANRILFDYSLNLSQEPLTRGFLCIVRKKAKGSTLDIPSLKDAFRLTDLDAWREVMKVVYEALLANATWVLVDCPEHPHFLTGKWAFKCKRDINRNMKKYKARWIGGGFQQQERIDYSQTYVSVVKAATHVCCYRKELTAFKSM